jgi:hypothetical protein
LRKLDLPLALPSARTPGEDVENQLRPIDHLALEFLLELAELCGRELVIEDDKIYLGLSARRR